MSRLLAIIIAALLLFAAGAPVHAQDDDVSLGDLARAMRKTKPEEDKPVIDNDNLPVMMDKAEAERLNGKPVFSIDPSGKTFRMTSPDGTCSLSFDARAAALISTPYIASEVPRDELAKLEGVAVLHDGIVEVTLRNQSEWELKEIVISITQLNQTGLALQPARLIADFQLEPKLPDITTLYHLKATAPAGSSTVFRAAVNDDVAQSKSWHWALVTAKGIPPAATLPAASASVKPFASGELPQAAAPSQTNSTQPPVLNVTNSKSEAASSSDQPR